LGDNNLGSSEPGNLVTILRRDSGGGRGYGRNLFRGGRPEKIQEMQNLTFRHTICPKILFDRTAANATW
jgi:hypothetical protein